MIVDTLKPTLAALVLATVGLGGAPAAFAADPEYTIRFSEIASNRGPRAEALMWWEEAVEERSGGRIDVEISWGGALASHRDNVKAVGSGLADAGTVVAVFTPAEFPIWLLSSTPFMFGDFWVGVRTMQEAHETIPELTAEGDNQGVKIIANNSAGPVQLVTVDRQIRTAEDVAGLKLATNGGWVDLLAELGANIVSVDGGEHYNALDTGIIDGLTHYTPLVRSYKLYEVSSYLTEAYMGQQMGYGVGINKELFEEMPEDLQQIIVETGREYMDVYAEKYTVDMDVARQDMAAGIEGQSIEVYELPAEERAKFMAAAQPLVDKWIETVGEKGMDGERILADIQAIQAKYQAELEEKGYPWTR